MFVASNNLVFENFAKSFYI